MYQIFKHNNFSSSSLLRNGFIFLEVLVAIAIISIAFVALLGVILLSLNTSPALQKKAQADFLVREELEAVRTFRDTTLWNSGGVGSLTIGDVYHATLDLAFSPPEWTMSTGSETIGIFTRQVVFNTAYRDAVGNLQSPGVCPGGASCIADANTRQVTVTVTHEGKTYQIIMFLTNWQQK